MDSETLIFACGNPLLDISAPCEEAAIKEYGLMYGGAILSEEKHKSLFEELKGNESVEYIPGGSALNTARCANVSL